MSEGLTHSYFKLNLCPRSWFTRVRLSLKNGVNVGKWFPQMEVHGAGEVQTRLHRLPASVL